MARKSRKKNAQIAIARGKLAQGVAVYGRVSTRHVQNPATSRQRQYEDVERVLLPMNLLIKQRFFDIESGLVSDRAEYTELQRQAEAGCFSHIAIAAVDRSGRDVPEGLRFFHHMTELGIIIVIANQPFLDYTNSVGKMIITQLLTNARFESDTIGARALGGMYVKAKTGGWNWKGCDGYRNREERLPSTGENNRYRRWIEADHEQLKVWRLAADLLLGNEPVPPEE